MAGRLACTDTCVKNVIFSLYFHNKIGNVGSTRRKSGKKTVNEITKVRMPPRGNCVVSGISATDGL